MPVETEKGGSKVCATAMVGFDASSHEVKGTLQLIPLTLKRSLIESRFPSFMVSPMFSLHFRAIQAQQKAPLPAEPSHQPQRDCRDGPGTVSTLCSVVAIQLHRSSIPTQKFLVFLFLKCNVLQENGFDEYFLSLPSLHRGMEVME